jgi:hypothetical protein
LNYPIARRTFIAGGIAASICGMTYSEDTAALPQQRKYVFRALSAQQAANLNRLGEAMVPGSSRHGLAHYVDYQLANPAEKSMLMVKYLNISQPYHEFYRSGLRASDALALRRFRRPIVALDDSQALTLIRAIANETLQGWDGPPPPLFFFALKADAVDVTYGTAAGFKSLGVPYMAHIEPPTPWGE